jgi:hypothetical protein
VEIVHVAEETYLNGEVINLGECFECEYGRPQGDGEIGIDELTTMLVHAGMEADALVWAKRLYANRIHMSGVEETIAMLVDAGMGKEALCLSFPGLNITRKAVNRFFKTRGKDIERTAAEMTSNARIQQEMRGTPLG